MNLFIVQSRRRLMVTALLAAMLILTSTFFCVGFAAWYGAQKQLSHLDDKYTTIAMIKNVDSSILTEDEFIKYFKKKNAALDLVSHAPQIKAIDNRILLLGAVEGMSGVAAGSINPLDYSLLDAEDRYALAVMALRCKSIDYDTPQKVSYSAMFDVIEVLSMFDGYDAFKPIDEIKIVDGVYLADKKTASFEEGKTYLVFGKYYDYPVWDVYSQGADGGMEIVRTRMREANGRTFNQIMVPIGSFPNSEFGYSLTPETISGERTTTINFNSFNCIKEYEGDVNSFIESDEGSEWREMIDICSLNHSSSAVFLTDNIQSMYSFNVGKTSILDGRHITSDEYARGGAVCLISAEYALVNNLSVGDSVNISLYDSGCQITERSTADPKTVYFVHPCTQEDIVAQSKAYEIVGIYSGAEYDPDIMSIRPDTIIVPKASVLLPSDGLRPVNSSELLLTSYILKNGTQSEFESYMRGFDCGDMFLYYDQEYSHVASSFKRLGENAMRLLIVSLCIFVLAGALYVYLNMRRMSPIARSMRLIGASEKSVSYQMLASYALLSGISLLTGTSAGILLYNTASKQLLSTLIDLDPVAVIICAAIQAAVLFAAGALSIHGVAKKQLMQTERKKKQNEA